MSDSETYTGRDAVVVLGDGGPPIPIFSGGYVSTGGTTISEQGEGVLGPYTHTYTPADPAPPLNLYDTRRLTRRQRVDLDGVGGNARDRRRRRRAWDAALVARDMRVTSMRFIHGPVAMEATAEVQWVSRALWNDLVASAGGSDDR